LNAPFSPATADPALAALYRSECARLGFEPRLEGMGEKPMGPGFVMISDDPNTTWAQIAEAALYDAETYASWQDDTARSDWVVPDLQSVDDLRTSGRYLVLTPEQCIRQVEQHGGITLHPLMGGITPELAWPSLRLFESAVLPHVAP